MIARGPRFVNTGHEGDWCTGWGEPGAHAVLTEAQGERGMIPWLLEGQPQQERDGGVRLTSR